MVTTGFIHQLIPCTIFMAICGAAWITMISTVSTAAQMALPNWVRSRGLSINVAILMGSLAFGSIIWGNVAKYSSIPLSLATAAIGAIVAIPLTRRWHISGIEKIDLTPSMHWDTPITHEQITHNRGPAMIVIHYRLTNQNNKHEFLSLVHELGRSRRRDGAYAWDIMEDVRDPAHYIEYYMVESWLEYLRQHERVTNEEKTLQGKLRELLVDKKKPEVTHFVGT